MSHTGSRSPGRDDPPAGVDAGSSPGREDDDAAAATATATAAAAGDDGDDGFNAPDARAPADDPDTGGGDGGAASAAAGGGGERRRRGSADLGRKLGTVAHRMGGARRASVQRLEAFNHERRRAELMRKNPRRGLPGLFCGVSVGDEDLTRVSCRFGVPSFNKLLLFLGFLVAVLGLGACVCVCALVASAVHWSRRPCPWHLYLTVSSESPS